MIFIKKLLNEQQTKIIIQNEIEIKCLNRKVFAVIYK